MFSFFCVSFFFSFLFVAFLLVFFSFFFLSVSFRFFSFFPFLSLQVPAGLATPVGMTAVTPTDRPKSVRNRGVIEVFGGVFHVVTMLLDFSVGVGAIVIGLSQISSFFS